MLDLSNFKVADLSVSLDGQTNYTQFKPLSKFNLAEFIYSQNNSDPQATIAHLIENVRTVDSGDRETSASSYDSTTGIVEFATLPKYYIRYDYKVFGDSSGKMTVTLTGNTNQYSVGEDSKVQTIDIDDNGNLSYTIEQGETATLHDVLTYLDENYLASVKAISINSQITEIKNETLRVLNLESLDLSEASSLTDTTLDLSGAKIDNVKLSSNTNIEAITLSQESAVKNINANGATKLKTLEISGNGNIETIDISNTSVAVIYALNCTELKSLKAKSTGAIFAFVEGCNVLETLDVSDNNLLMLDLSDVSDTLTKYDVNGQKNDISFKASKDVDLSAVILKGLADGSLKDIELGISSYDIVEKIDKGVEEIDSNDKVVQEASSYSSATGVATFAKAPTKPNYVRYYYDVFGNNNNVEALVAAVNDANNGFMDVTLTGNTNEEIYPPETPQVNKIRVSIDSVGAHLSPELWPI